MGIDIETFKTYAKINSYVWGNHEGSISQERLRELIGVEFSIMSSQAVERHFQNMIMAGFFLAGTNTMKAVKINWVEFEEKLKRKSTELAQGEALKVVNEKGGTPCAKENPSKMN